MKELHNFGFLEIDLISNDLLLYVYLIQSLKNPILDREGNQKNNSLFYFHFLIKEHTSFTQIEHTF